MANFEKTYRAPKHAAAPAPRDFGPLPLGTVNFCAMAGAAVLIIAGFILMAGGASQPDTFNEDVFSARRIIVGPMLAFLGFVAMAVAIIIRPKKSKTATAE